MIISIKLTSKKESRDRITLSWLSFLLFQISFFLLNHLIVNFWSFVFSSTAVMMNLFNDSPACLAATL